MIGEQIRRARVTGGESLRRLSRRTGISHTAINKYELGKDMPGSANLIKLAKALGVSYSYFFQPVTIQLCKPVFRSKHRLSRKDQKRIEWMAIEFLQRYQSAEHLAGQTLKKFKVPKSAHRKVQSYDALESIANNLRDEWDLGNGPIQRLVESLEDRGIKIVLLASPIERFDGCSLFYGDNTPTIIVGREWPGDRQRFTVAHELSHLLFSHLAENLDAEKAANRFAGAFLMPQDAVRHELGSRRKDFALEELTELKAKYGVSMLCIVHRAQELGVISENSYRKIRRAFKVNGWEQQEPDQGVPQENPRRLERLVTQAVIEELITESRAAELLQISISELRGHVRPIRAQAAS